MKPLEKLISLLSKDKVIPVVGAGVSFAAAGLPGWLGAIENGLAYAEDRRITDNELAGQVKELLKSGDLVKAADLLKLLLKAPKHPYSDWLNDLFGISHIRSTELLDSIHDLCTPILLTTNYDDLLSETNKIHKKKVFDWTCSGEIARAIKKDEEFILHLHGTYQKPDSVILSSTDYQQLAGEKGYKAILQKLWTDYHFLFIGCSRDGIMDPDFITVIDFINEWFPDYPHEHFILMQEDDFGKGQHQELLEKCNVHAISYGINHSDLPGFINDLNPNGEKIRRRNEAFLEEINAGFKRLVRVTGELTSDQTEVNMFVKNSLPGKAYWVDSVELKMLEDVLDNYNAQLNNKRQQLAGSQAIVRGLVSINTLAEYVELWNENWHNPERLRKSSMIDTALIAFNCLKAFPKEMLNEIRLRAWGAVHGLYFDGYLDHFIHEIKYIKEQNGHTSEELYADRYFFENLKRIIQSLKGLLALDPEKVFPDLPEATITPETNFGLLFLAEHEISLRSDIFPYALQARLPGESSLLFKGAEFTGFDTDRFVLGYTAQYCFSWDPHKDLSPRIFYTALIGEEIAHVISSKRDTNLYSYVFTGNKLLIFRNLKLHATAAIAGKFGNLVLLPDEQGFLGSTSVSANTLGTFITKIELTGETSSVYTVQELWELIGDIPNVQELFQTLPGVKVPSMADAYIQGTRIKGTLWFDKPVIVLTAMVSLRFMKSSFLIVFNYQGGKLTPLSRVFFPLRICYSYALINSSNRMDLVAGYLGMGSFQLVQYFKGIDQAYDTTIDRQPAIIERVGYENADILAMQTISPSRLIVLQESEKLFEISLPEMTERSVAVEHLIKVIPVSS